MYLGALLILLGFTVATLSILSFIVWLAFFIFWDQMATYEEKDLHGCLGSNTLSTQMATILALYKNWAKKINKKLHAF